MHATSRRGAAAAFLATMPPRYRDLYEGAAAREHATIVARRAGSPAHVELWRKLPRGGGIACVVADDRPGLLSFISAALVVSGMDVEAAQVFTRGADEPEAVDLFWLRREGAANAPVLEADMARIAAVLQELVTGRASIEEVSRRARAQAMTPGRAQTRVTFDSPKGTGVSVLTVETFDRPGLLLAITRALYRARVQIIASEATSETGRVVDRFSLVELDGAPLRPSRMGVLQVEVLAAVDALTYGATGT